MEPYLDITKKWVEQWVIGLNLCPFAGLPYHKGLIRYELCETDDPEVLMQTLLQELVQLHETPESALMTTLLVHPNILTDFEAYLDFVSEAQMVIQQVGLEGVFQLATFHPAYLFADAPIDDPANYTNRSPYPMLHLLREDSISEAVANFTDIEDIPLHNTTLLRRMGLAEIRSLLTTVKRGS